MNKYTDSELKQDVERVNQIAIVPILLDVICQTTGMGFAAVARVTSSRWITCSVRDDIQFGLVPGAELKLETTICNEIQGSHQPVVIDHVDQSELYWNHHTPAQYGFQSYISFPIFLKTGELFGTLCAIDPKPARLDNPRIKGLFTAFADLISFHLQQTDLLEQSDQAVTNLSRQLTQSEDENRQYRHIANHNLQEPLRKLRLFSTMLVDVIRRNEMDQAEATALKINGAAEKFARMIKDLANFSVLDQTDGALQETNLHEVLSVVATQLAPKLRAKKASLQVGELPIIQAIPIQIEQLFYHLLDNSIKFARQQELLVISVTSQVVAGSWLGKSLSQGSAYVHIQVVDNGIGMPQSQLEKLFDMFAKLPADTAGHGEGFGLTYSRKVVHNHGGQIKIESEVNRGTTVSILLPVY
ncbi:sensor histidine kinase [Spirosoma linguale]|uniref:histidine kinase n=1 Tax=Spirosoma linguale (strain ATCC 33905 / DSM 74 / LMG 10896 / Claus 1) TaxID=504472 RepID=D2QDR9_SPILD|nr:GAF sensor signal transduction histidine kinase [Spirosoma linguale DSM 74]